MNSSLAGYLKKISMILLVAFIGLAAFLAHEWYADKPFYVNNFYNRSFIKMMFQNPEGLTSMGMLEQVGIKGHNAKWGDASLKGNQEQFEFMKDIFKSMKMYSDEELSEQELISKKIIMQLLGNPELLEKYQFHNYPVNQLFGVQNMLPNFLDSSHRVEVPVDADHYITRLSTMHIKFEQIMEGIKKREELGIIPPTFVIDKSIENMKNFIDKSTEENILYVSFKKKMEEATEFPKELHEKYLKQASEHLQKTIFPTYQSYISYFTKLREKSDNRAGVWKLPDGESFYNYMLHVHTTTNMKANEVHQIGLKEVDRIQKEMLSILSQEGFDASLGFTQVMKQLSEKSEFYYSDDKVGRDKILEDYGKIIDEIKNSMGDAFKDLPKADVIVKRVPEFSEKTAPGAYYNGPTMDGKKPGTFFANLYDIKATPKYGMRTLAYHEAIPGHHFQNATQIELTGVPEFRKQISFTAYSEGWALYAERLAWELGFQKDPYDNIGRLQAEIFRAVRLVVDTGIHAKRWTREQAIRYMLDNTGMAESDIVSEIERYIVNPGQATSYKVGMMEILRLREEAKKALGDKFALADFHKVILKSGPLPLFLLREHVEKYINDKMAS